MVPQPGDAAPLAHPHIYRTRRADLVSMLEQQCSGGAYVLNSIVHKGPALANLHTLRSLVSTAQKFRAVPANTPWDEISDRFPTAATKYVFAPV